MRISAVIPTYNRREYVLRAIGSILAQTVEVDEIIVIDDGSTDGTAAEVESRFEGRVSVVRQANLGVSAARRRGVLEAKGDWIAFLDSDDEWTPDRTRIFLRAIESVPADVAWIFGDVLVLQDVGGVTLYQKHGLRVERAVHVFENALSVQYPFQFGLLQGSVIKRDVLVKLNCFSHDLKHSEDVLVGFQVSCSSQNRLAAIPDVVTKLYRTSDLSNSSLMTKSSTDYYRARMEAFSLVIGSGRSRPWGKLYAETVRGLCKELAGRGEHFRRLSLEQFRYEVSCKSVGFFCAAMAGNTGLILWSKAAAIGRAVRSNFAASPVKSSIK